MKLLDVLVVVLLLILVLVSSISIIGDDGVGQARQTLYTQLQPHPKNPGVGPCTKLGAWFKLCI